LGQGTVFKQPLSPHADTGAARPNITRLSLPADMQDAQHNELVACAEIDAVDDDKREAGDEQLEGAVAVSGMPEAGPLSQRADHLADECHGMLGECGITRNEGGLE
jgi:hypothetical protein